MTSSAIPAPKGFVYSDTDSHVECVYKDGEWGALETVADPYIKIHMSAGTLHYGQTIFEGMKAEKGKDGVVRLFRPDENAKRLNRSAKRLMMPTLDPDFFIEAVMKAVKENIRFVPEFGTGSLYIRPYMFATQPVLGLDPATEYKFVVFVVPVGDFYSGAVQSIPAFVVENSDRAAPLGVGAAKVAGNYAASMASTREAKANGYPITLFLDAKTRTYVEEFATSNFVGISACGQKYLTPCSASILASITNKSLEALASDLGLSVERRPILIEEVKEFSEVGAVGTAVVCSPISQIVYKSSVFNIRGTATGLGPILQKLYDALRAVQQGEAEDKHGWIKIVTA
ncbi:branched-chain amino acid aminotransferase [Sphaeroforma arctica JP610]|uniref:Branched-chain amino acid aminotransferase n=1 Tax=Sphaeroforma arctica JP610 TaxID=667725 RepID=A0A0L0GBU7_9EUKA|nr:branched-chain amino acid aminotransferase [Sphaeroforma arctica JP610]KNC86470.1 branched-chain amino acid aminotransferase [Sphaeroforma arctica JP610]|eukprot:XP_014160372.1 branched-chain amino acid aminotransferase [Sphaeroforma arctica JP610]